MNVNAAADDTIILRDISITGAGTGLKGINYIWGGTLVVDHCSIYGIKGGATARSIDVALNNNGKLKVLDTIIENVAEDGIHLNTTAGQLLVTIDNTGIMNCGKDGIEAVANVRGTISHSRFTHNSTSGVKTSGSNSQLNLNDIFVSYASVGL